MRLILLRHGLTDDNVKKRYCGFRDPGLTLAGQRQSQKAREKLKAVGITKAFCSDLKRSEQTADILFGDSGIPIEQKRSLREINFGEWEGMTFAEIFRKYPQIYKEWTRNPFAVSIPGGEKMRYFVRRITATLDKIYRRHGRETVAIVGHLGVIRVILNQALGLSEDEFWHLKIEPRAIYLLEHNGATTISELH